MTCPKLLVGLLVPNLDVFVSSYFCVAGNNGRLQFILIEVESQIFLNPASDGTPGIARNRFLKRAFVNDRD